MAAPVLAALGEDAVDLVGGLALPEVAAVLARCALFVGNDSGLMHLSAATGTPTLGPVRPLAGRGLCPGRAPHRDGGGAGQPGARQHARPDPGDGAGGGGAAAGGEGAGVSIAAPSLATAPPPATPRISALVVARNEAARLPACLATLAAADEIVVVLDRSTDASAEIARGHGARLLEGGWELEGERRNAGIAACTGDWILEVDADERVPPELWAEIRRVVAGSAHAFHRVRIDNYVGERLILHGWGGSFGTTLKPILFRRGAKHWRGQRVHPGLDWTRDTRGRADHRARHPPRGRPRHLRHAAAARQVFLGQGGGPAGGGEDRLAAGQPAALRLARGSSAMSGGRATRKAAGAC